MTAYAGMESATANAPEAYKQAYIEEAERLIAAGKSFTSDDITEVVGMPPNPNAVGGLVNGIVRKHGLVVVGREPMRRPEANRRQTNVYGVAS